MSVQVADSVENLFDGEINVNQPLDWEFLGAQTCRPWSRWESFQAGECVSLPNGETWCARRNVNPGDVGPGEQGWKHAWDRLSTMLGADPAAEAARAQRRHGRGGDPLVGALVADFQSVKELYQDAADDDEQDVVGDDPVAKAAEDTKKIIERARDEAIPAQPPARVTHYDETDEIDIDPVQLEILGSDGLDEADFPVTAELYRHFHSRKEEPKYVRLDTESSYRDFRAGQSPELAELRQKVTALEALVHAHVADGHGAQDIIVGLASDVASLQDATAAKRVPLQMPPWAEGTWDCWREEGPDGGLVCCSIALPGHDGYVRICTAASPVRKRAEDVTRYAEETGSEVRTLLGVLPTIACMLAGRDLMTDMAAAAPKVLAHPAARENQPFVGKIVPANQPTLAALMALLQAAQTGNAQAKKEWEALSQTGNRELTESMIEAKRRLIAVQAQIFGWARR